MSESTDARKKGLNVQEKRIPIVENLAFVLGQFTVIRYGVLGVETRHAESLGAILAGKDVVRAAFAIHVAFAGDVEYVA